jgi:thiamine-monophosphate kinase
MSGYGEFDIIREFFSRPGHDDNVVLGIGDDAALLAVPTGEVLVVTTDTLVTGCHFPENALAYDIGWKSLAVNLSDLAAMGAKARWVTLAITLPDNDADFLREFTHGFFSLADQNGVRLVGGDTTRGPLSITVTAMGTVPVAQALRRDGARPGDDLYVSGTLGDAGLGLRLTLEQWPDAIEPQNQAIALERLNRPQPRLALGLALRDLATACMDVSDGLAQDLSHLLRASQVGAELNLDALPLSPALQAIDPAFATIFALTSGDDYELLFTAPVHARDVIARLSIPCQRIGCITEAHGLIFQRDGHPVDMPVAGYTHF